MRIVVAALLSAPVPLAYAQWTAVSLHPAGATRSECTGVSATHQVGIVVAGGASHAALWAGTPASYMDLHPAGHQSSFAWAIDGEQVAGSAVMPGLSNHACLWTIAGPSSWLDIHPDGIWGVSAAYATRNGQQAGMALAGSFSYAGRWNSTAASFVTLQSSSLPVAAVGLSGGVAVGSFTDPIFNALRARAWGACGTSLIVPNSSESAATGISAGEISGWARVSESPRAIVWALSNCGSRDITPTAAPYAWANAISNGWQAGRARIGVQDHASVWQGTAATWEDLHQYLPGSYRSSTANAIWADGSSVYIAGAAVPTGSNNSQAILWSRPLLPACYANCDGSTAAPIVNVNDFVCFQQKYAAGDPYANCDGSTVPPVLNVSDFTCFLNRYTAGCP